MKKRILSIILICTTLFGLMACGEKDDEINTNACYLYYVNKEKTALEKNEYKIKKDSIQAKVKELIEEMNEPVSDVEFIVAKPDDVELIKYEVNSNIVNVTFSETYLSMSVSEEILYRTALVLTLTQVEGIEYVAIFINDLPLTDPQGVNIGNMQAADFVFDMGSSINSYYKENITLYFANRSGSKLVGVVESEINYKDVSLDRYIVDKIINGPTDSSLQMTISPKAIVNSVVTKDGICYVDFDKSFINNTTNVSGEITIYSIVNSLLELSYIQKIQIMVDGTTDYEYKGISLDQLFTRNLDIVEAINEESTGE